MTRSVLAKTLIMVTLAVWVMPAHADTILFSNLVQPGNLFGPDPVGVGAIPVPGFFVSSATNFTPGFDSRLTSLVLPLAVVSGPTEINVLLLADSGNLPGGVLESFHLIGLPLAGPLSLVPIGSSLHPVLNAGTQYWVAVTGGTSTTFAFWGLTLFAGDPTAGGASRSII